MKNISPHKVLRTTNGSRYLALLEQHWSRTVRAAYTRVPKYCKTIYYPSKLCDFDIFIGTLTNKSASFWVLALRFFLVLFYCFIHLELGFHKVTSICFHEFLEFMQFLLNLFNFIYNIGPLSAGFVPIPKAQKIVLDTALLRTQHYKVRIKGKVVQYREWSSALSYTTVL